MPRNKPYSGAALLTMLIAIVATVVMVTACSRITYVPRPVDVTVFQPCPGEAGPATPDADPCVWDSTRAPNQVTTPQWRWVLYADTCPGETVQDHRLVRCIPRGEWGNQ